MIGCMWVLNGCMFVCVRVMLTCNEGWGSDDIAETYTEENVTHMIGKPYSIMILCILVPNR